MTINIKKKECRGYRVVSAFAVLTGKYNPVPHLRQRKAGLRTGGWGEGMIVTAGERKKSVPGSDRLQ